jgi:hypothetical protein
MSTAQLVHLTEQMDLAGTFHRYAPQDDALYVHVRPERAKYDRWLTAELATEAGLYVSKTEWGDMLKVAAR